MLKTILVLLSLSVCVSYKASTIAIDEKYIAGVIYAEAQGESFGTKQYVATVIFERSGGAVSNFIKTCVLPRQFASPEYSNDKNDKSWQEASAIARSMYHQTFVPLTITIDKRQFFPDHFYHGKTTPFWARGQKYVKSGRIRFLHLGKYRRS